MGRLRKIDIWLPIIIGTTAFVLFTGGKIIVPTYRDWLMWGDTAQNFIGWEFFRHTPIFQWPIGANPNLGLEFSSSIVFTDSTPLPAIVFKFLNPILPSTFQYFGLWIWACFVLQSIFGWKLLSNFITHRVQLAVGTIFFAISPVLLYRLIHYGYGHISLAGQWLILASLHLYFNRKFQAPKWAVLICIALLVHAYFFPMVVAVWIAAIIQHLRVKSMTFGSTFRHIALVGALCFITLWASGYFIVGRNANPDGWDYLFRWQPLSLVDSGTGDSIGWSRLLPDRRQLAGDAEGFSYLGSGIIMLTLILLCFRIAVMFKVSSRRTTSWLLILLVLIAGLAGGYYVDAGNSIRMLVSVLVGTSIFLYAIWTCSNLFMRNRMESRHFYRHAPILVATSLMAIYSMTNRIGIGYRTLFTYPLIQPIQQFTETFRTHGRFIWPAYYLFVLFVLIEATRKLSPKIGTAVLVACLTFYVYDSKEALQGVNARFTDIAPWSSPMKDPQWSQLAREYESLIVVPALNNDLAGRWLAVTDFARIYHLATNSGFFNRFDNKKSDLLQKELYNNVSGRKFNPDSLYIIEDGDLWINLSTSVTNVRFIGDLDGYKVIAP